jgi:mycofactocin precursor
MDMTTDVHDPATLDPATRHATAGGPADDDSAKQLLVDVEDSLIEEISIDGMCGVY